MCEYPLSTKAVRRQYSQIFKVKIYSGTDNFQTKIRQNRLHTRRCSIYIYILFVTSTLGVHRFYIYTYTTRARLRLEERLFLEETTLLEDREREKESSSSSRFFFGCVVLRVFVRVDGFV